MDSDWSVWAQHELYELGVKYLCHHPSSSADVIDLSSGEDDHIVHISSESTKQEEESEPSGMHTNDALNQADAQGRVLVNVNHPAGETDIFLSPQLARAVKPHQVSNVHSGCHNAQTAAYT